MLGALVYVAYAVGIGYAVGYGLGEYVERLRRVVGEIEHIVLAAAVIFTLVFLGWRAVHAARERK